MREIWEKAGLNSIEQRVVRIPIVDSDFDDFCASNIVPIGPRGMMLSKLSAGEMEQLRARLRQQLPIDADGRISYEAFANTIKGRVPH